jgi:acetyl-CoA hydrolase
MYPTAARLRSVAAPAVSALLRERIKRPSMLNKLCKPEDLLEHFPNGAYIGWSGFTGVGYPKYVFAGPDDF